MIDLSLLQQTLPLAIAYFNEKKRQKVAKNFKDFKSWLSDENAELLQKIEMSSKSTTYIKALLNENISNLNKMLLNQEEAQSFLESIELAQKETNKKVDRILETQQWIIRNFKNGDKYKEIVESMFSELDLKNYTEEDLLIAAKKKVAEYKKYEASKPTPIAETESTNKYHEYLQNGQILDAREFLYKIFLDLKLNNEDKSTELAQLAFHLGELSYYLSQYSQSHKYFTQAVSLDTNARYLKQLASIENILGQHVMALKHYLKAKELLEVEYSSDSMEIANVLSDIGYTRERLGQYDEALDDFIKSNKITELHVGRDNNLYNTTQNNIAHLYTEIGRLNEAAKIYVDVIKNDIKIFGPEHPNTAASYNNLGGVLMYSNSYDKALNFFRLSRTILQKHEKLESYTIGIVCMNIAICLNRLGLFDEAVKEYRAAEKLLLRFFNEYHPDVSRVRENLGYCYYEAGMKKEGISELESALKGYKESYGDLNHKTISVKNNLNQMRKV